MGCHNTFTHNWEKETAVVTQLPVQMRAFCLLDTVMDGSLLPPDTTYRLKEGGDTYARTLQNT